METSHGSETDYYKRPGSLCSLKNTGKERSDWKRDRSGRPVEDHSTQPEKVSYEWGNPWGTKKGRYIRMEKVIYRYDENLKLKER